MWISGSRSEPNTCMEGFFKELFLALRTPQFEFNRGPVLSPQRDVYFFSRNSATQVFDGGGMGTVESIGDSKDRRKFADSLLIIGIESPKTFVLDLRMTLPVIPCNVCDNFLFVFREAQQFRIPN